MKHSICASLCDYYFLYFVLTWFDTFCIYGRNKTQTLLLSLLTWRYRLTKINNLYGSSWHEYKDLSVLTISSKLLVSGKPLLFYEQDSITQWDTISKSSYISSFSYFVWDALLLFIYLDYGYRKEWMSKRESNLTLEPPVETTVFKHLFKSSTRKFFLHCKLTKL